MTDTPAGGDSKTAVMSRRERRDRGMRRTAGRGKARRKIGGMLTAQRQLDWAAALNPDIPAADVPAAPARRGRS